MYLILSRRNAVEHDIASYAATLEEAREFVALRMAECGGYTTRLHPEAFKIVHLVEAHGGPER